MCYYKVWFFGNKVWFECSCFHL